MKRKRIRTVECYTNIDAVTVEIARTIAGKQRHTTHYNITPTSYARLRTVIFTMLVGHGYIELMTMPTHAYGWTYHA